ncbi:MAG: cysteine desulfurase [Cyclobacteriaceae bacterium]|nr:cysteine desulfurase [Cyclobacteriaceae bacterium]
MKKQAIYLDYNATTPCDPGVVEAMIPYFSRHYGNPSSADHWYGWMAKDAIDEARTEISDLIGAKPEEIIFTSGATESVNLALKGLADFNQHQKKHIITCATEHKAVLDTCAFLEESGYTITRLSTDTDGNISLSEMEANIREDTLCIALMYANNETGVLHPLHSIAAICRKYDVLFFCDATQAVGKLPLDVKNAGIDLMAFSSHKMYGPKGTGALYINSEARSAGILPQIHGGKHEKGMRSGTLNVPAIVGFGEAARICKPLMAVERERLKNLRDTMERDFLSNIPGSRVNGGENRMEHVSNLTFPGIHAEKLLLSVSGDLALSRGSACAGLLQKPSHVLKAMGLSDADALSTLRISLGRFTQEADVFKAIELLKRAILSKQHVVSGMI